MFEVPWHLSRSRGLAQYVKCLAPELNLLGGGAQLNVLFKLSEIRVNGSNPLSSFHL